MVKSALRTADEIVRQLIC